MAIAFDTAATGTTGLSFSSSLTIAKTCSGLNGILIVGVQITTSTDDITGITYNGVAMTRLDEQIATGAGYMYVYYLLSPSTGTHNIIISKSPAGIFFAAAVSYTGVRAIFPDNETKNTFSSSPSTTTLTTILDNCWCVLFTSGYQTYSPSTNATQRASIGSLMSDSNGVVTPPGSFSMSITYSSGSGGGNIMMSLAPAGGTLTQTLTENVNHTDTISKQLNRILSENIHHTDSFGSVHLKAQTLTENVHHTDIFGTQRVTSKVLTENVHHTDTFTHARTAFKVLRETVNHTESFLRTFARTFLENVIHIDTFLTPGFWRDRTRPSTSWADRTKPTDTWTDRSKPTTPWSSSPPPENSWTDRTKPPTTWSS